MALSNSEKQRIINMLDRLSDSEREAATRSENSLWKWLKSAARWLWEKFSNTVIGNVVNWLLGW